jgi:TP901 family phage tail tape measure protein
MGILPPVIARLFADIRQYEANMAKADATMKKFGTTSMTTSEKMAASMNSIANKVLVTSAVIGTVSVKMAADFQSATTRLATDAGESVKNLGMIRQGILDMAQSVGQTPKQLADGMYYIESAGYHGADALTVLKASAEGAVVGFTDMASMGSAVTTVLRDYNLPASRAAAVTSALIETVAQGKTTMTLLANSMGRVLPIAAAFGIPFAQTAAAIATMTVSGQQARFGVQQIRNAFMNLAAPGNMASKTMKAIGISGNELHRVLMNPKTGVADAIKLITEALGKSFPKGSAEYIGAQRKIYGGITGLSVALALGGDHMDKYLETVKLIGHAYDSTNPRVKNFEEISKTLNFQFKQLAAAGGVFAVQIGDWLLPKVSSIAQWGLGVITWFKSHPLVSKIASDATIGLFVGAVIFKLGKGINTIFNNVKSLGSTIGSKTGLIGSTASFEQQSLLYLRVIAESTAKTAGLDFGKTVAAGAAAATAGAGTTALVAGSTAAAVVGAAVLILGTKYVSDLSKTTSNKGTTTLFYQQLADAIKQKNATTNVTLNLHTSQYKKGGR